MSTHQPMAPRPSPTPGEPAPDGAPGAPRGRLFDTEDLVALVVVAAGLTVAVALAAAGDGFYHDDDACHYLYARDAWTDAKALWHVWARPGYNVPAMFAAHLGGLFGCRLLSAVQTALTAWLAYRIARRIFGRSGKARWFAALAPALVWAQPLVMTLAQTTLTESPAGLYLTLAAWLYLRGNRVWSCAAASALFVTRPETAALAVIFAVAVVYDALREARWNVGGLLRTPWLYACALAMLWAPVVWAWGAWATDLPMSDSPLGMFSRGYTSEYGAGAWHHFLMMCTEASGGGAIALAVAGAVHFGRRAWLVTALAFGLVALHTIVFRFGLFASGGYARFLVPGGGLVAVLAVGGVKGLCEGRRWVGLAAVGALAAAWGLALARHYPGYERPQELIAAVTSILAVLVAVSLVARSRSAWRALGPALAMVALLAVGVQAGIQVRPLRCDHGMHRAVTATVRALRETPVADHRILTTHVLVPCLRGNADIVAGVADARARWRRVPAGTLFFWDSKYGGKPTDTEPVSPLYGDLCRLGRSVCWRGDRYHWAEVFIRMPDKPQSVWTWPLGLAPPTSAPAD